MERLEELSLQVAHILLFSHAAHITLLQEVCYQYWPADDIKGVQKYGEFTVSVLQTTKQDGFIQRNISITNPEVNGMKEHDKFCGLKSHPVSACCKIMSCPKLVTSCSLIFVQLEFRITEAHNNQCWSVARASFMAASVRYPTCSYLIMLASAFLDRIF